MCRVENVHVVRTKNTDVDRRLTCSVARDLIQ
jgi:hypothetical protein